MLRVMGWVMLFLGCCATAVAQEEAGQEKRKIAVMNLKVGKMIDQDTAKIINEIMLNEFQEIGDLEVLAYSDVLAVLQAEEQRMMLGCNDESCLMELGGALGVPLLAAPSIGTVGDKHVINIKIIHVPTAEVLARVSEVVPASRAALITTFREAIAKVVEEAGLMSDSVAFSRSVMEVSPWVGLGLTVAAGGVAAVFAGLSMADADSAQGYYQGTQEWRDAKDASESKALIADVMFGVAGAAALATTVLFIVANSQDDLNIEDINTSVSISPTPNGGHALLTLRF